MKHKLLTFLLALIVGAGTLFAQSSGNCGKSVFWQYAAGKLTISGIGTMDDYTYTGTTIPWRSYGYNIQHIIIEDGVKNIGNYTFTEYPNITSVTIGNSVEIIGEGAFGGCPKLTSIEIPNSVTSIGTLAFWNCTGLTSVTIPESVTSIGERAFWNCTGLTSVTIGKGVTSIGVEAFGSCSSLTSVTCKAVTPPACTSSFSNTSKFTLYVPAGSVEAYKEATGWKSAYKEVLPIEIEYIDSGTCGKEGDNLTWTLDEDGVLTISGTGEMADWTFDNPSPWNPHASLIKSAVIENGVTSIGKFAFYKCSDLTSVTIPESVTSIGESAFYNCSGLTSIYIPDGVTSIGFNAFSECTGLTSVTLPNTITSIERTTFFNCSALTSITIPNSVISIGEYSFVGCNNLTSLTIGNSVTSIGESAFDGCKVLIEITCDAITPPACGEDCFLNVDKSIPVYVPAQSVEAYKSADVWKDFENIQALPVHTCADANTALDGTTVQIAFADVIFVSGRYAYIQDETGTTLLYLKHADDNIQPGIRIMDLQGEVDIYHGLPEIRPSNQDDWTLAVPEEIIPKVVSLEDVPTAGMVNQLVLISKAPVEAGEFTTSSQSNLAIQMPNGGSAILRNQFRQEETFAENKVYDVMAAVAVYNTTVQLYFIQVLGAYDFYHVRFLSDDGETVLDDQIVPAGTVPVFGGEIPVKEDQGCYTYPFAGWDKTIYPASQDIDYKAVYEEEVKDYTVTFLSDDGETILGEFTVACGTDLSDPEIIAEIESYLDLTKKSTAQYNYTFAGWTPALDVLTGDATYTAVYEEELRYYTITWIDWDGSFIDEETYPYGDMPSHFGPTRGSTQQYDYTFSGWSPAIAPVSGDATYTAVYKETLCSYTVIWKMDDGSVIAQENYTYGDMPNHAAPVKESTAEFHYTFAGWSPNVVKVTGPAIYTAVFDAELRSYTVTWVNWDGTVLDKETYNYGSTPYYVYDDPTRPATAENTFTFTGWSPEISEVTGDVTYKAQFSATGQTYTITWKMDDGSVIAKETYAYGDMPNHAAPVKESTAQYNYTFTGWTPEISKVTGDATYAAVFKAEVRSYTVTWLNWDGAELAKETYAYGAQPEYKGNTPARKATAQFSYTFTGWNPAVAKVSGDATYTATFKETKNSYTITWKMDDGSVIAKETYAYGDMPSHAVPVKEATAQYTYTFTGWTPALTSVTGDATYTAVFSATERSYTVTWLNWDGKQLAKQSYAYGLTPSYNGAVPVRPATEQFSYTFTGWTPAVVPVSSDATYTAVFKETKNSYTITWKMDDGSVIAKETYAYGDMPNHAAPVKEATAQYTYTFTGWTPALTSVTGDATYTATFSATERSYTVTWLNWDGSQLAKESYKYGATPSFKGATPSRPATAQNTFTFTGWSPAIAPVSGDVTYKAQFSATGQTYTITWKMDDGSVIAKETYAYGDMPNHTAPVKEATTQYTYTFEGWTPAVVVVTSDATYTAVFKAEVRNYTVSWLNWDGSELAKESYAYGTQPAYKGATPSRPATEQFSYTFTGWTPAVAKVTGDATYTAVFKATVRSYKVTFLDKDGKVIEVQEVLYNEAAVAPQAPEVEGYIFIGWDKPFDAVKSDLTVKALYEEVKDYTPSNLNALLVPKADDVQITLSWDKVEGAASYELRVLADDVELFSQNTMTLNIISSPLSDIVNTCKINPGTYTMTWFVRSTDALGHAISDWAEGPQFEVTVKGQGFETTKDEVQSVKIYRNGRFYILRGDAIYTIQGQKVN